MVLLALYMTKAERIIIIFLPVIFVVLCGVSVSLNSCNDKSVVFSASCSCNTWVANVADKFLRISAEFRDKYFSLNQGENLC